MLAASPNRTREAWVIITVLFMGDGVKLGAFKQITNLAALDKRLNISGTNCKHCYMLGTRYRYGHGVSHRRLLTMWYAAALAFESRAWAELLQACRELCQLFVVSYDVLCAR